MKQPKKIFTRMLINNWGGISHKMLEFHEYVNLFSGKSGSGDSDIMMTDTINPLKSKFKGFHKTFKQDDLGLSLSSFLLN